MSPRAARKTEGYFMGYGDIEAAPKLPNLKSEPKFLNSQSKELECGMVGLPIIFNSIFLNRF